MMAVAYWICCVALLVTTAVKGLPNGAPTAACEDGTDLVPSHFFPPSTVPLPYEVNISHFVGNTYVPDQLYNITLRSLNTSESVFKGFMIQGRLVADNSPVGTWQVQAPIAKTVCNGNTSATHVNRDLKRLVTLSWKAPSAGTGTIRFRYSFVSTFSTYWSNLFTSDIREADKAVPSSAIVASSTSVIIAPTTSFALSNSTSSQQISFTSPTTALPDLQTTSTLVPTNTLTSIAPTTIPTTTTPNLVSCEDVTGYPVCSPDFCSSSRSKYARCSSRVDSCSNACQVTTCRVCIFTDRAVELPEECVEETCKSLRCVVRWSRCAYNKISTFQLTEEERKPENFKCFVPNCY